jgi:NAD(P)-dependent dehydrogenase (short-subunit alcohol dehydrogenase family)
LVIGQVAVITGGYSGIGYKWAQVLLDLQLSKLIFAVRTATRREDTTIKLREVYPIAAIKVWPIDMSSYPSIQEFVQRCTMLARIGFLVLDVGCLN